MGEVWMPRCGFWWASPPIPKQLFLEEGQGYVGLNRGAHGLKRRRKCARSKWRRMLGEVAIPRWSRGGLREPKARQKEVDVCPSDQLWCGPGPVLAIRYKIPRRWLVSYPCSDDGRPSPGSKGDALGRSPSPDQGGQRRILGSQRGWRTYEQNKPSTWRYNGTVHVLGHPRET